MRLEAVPVWKQVTPELQSELVAFWLEHGAIVDPDAAAQRAAQAVAIGRTPGGAIGGVSTASLRILPRLRQPVYYYRQFFAETHRGQGAARAFALASRDALAAHNAAGPQPEAVGVLMEFENRLVASHFALAVEDGFAFIGYSPRGNPLRLCYFEGARLFPPAPLRRSP